MWTPEDFAAAVEHCLGSAQPGRLTWEHVAQLLSNSADELGPHVVVLTYVLKLVCQGPGRRRRRSRVPKPRTSSRPLKVCEVSSNLRSPRHRHAFLPTHLHMMGLLG